MARWLLALLLALALVVSGHAVADDDDDDDDDGERGRERRDKRPAAVGAFDVRAASQLVTGDYVSFTYSDDGITSYAVGGAHLLDILVAGGESGGHRGTRAKGALVEISTPRYDLKVHDNPTATLKLETDGTAMLHFGAGALVRRAGDEVVTFRLGDLSGRVRGEDLAILNATQVRAKEELLVFLDAPRGKFDEHRERIGEGIANRAVGAELSVNVDNGDVHEDVVSYGNVTLTTIERREGALTILVDGHGFDGRVLVLNVDRRVIDAERAEDLAVLFDNVTIRPADSIADVLDPDDDGLHPEYYVVFDPKAEAFQMLVSVPHYSVHTVSIQSIFAQPPPPSVVLGVLGGVVMLAVAGAVLFRRPK